MKRGFAFQQAQIFFYVLEVKRLLAFLFSVLFVDSLDFLFYQFAHRLALVFCYYIFAPVTIYLPLDLWQPAIGMGHLVA